MVRRMNGRYGLLFLFAAMLTAMAYARPAAAQDGSILGSVVDAQGKPIEGATVTIELTDSGRKFNTKTDKKGEFTQIGLVGGNYTITVEKEGLKGSLTRRLQGGGRQNRLPPLTLSAGTPGGPSGAELQKLFTEGVDADRPAITTMRSQSSRKRSKSARSARTATTTWASRRRRRRTTAAPKPRSRRPSK